MVTIAFQQDSKIVINDSFSLYADAPFNDNTTNIGGKDNLAEIIMLQDVGYGLALFSRKFETGDDQGD